MNDIESLNWHNKRYCSLNTIIRDPKLPIIFEVSRSLDVYYRDKKTNALIGADFIVMKKHIGISYEPFEIVIKGRNEDGTLIYDIFEKGIKNK